ncbi:Scr1 family TA system antitoxin-like transcriptional regulator [Nocardiopsis alba]|uniref:Scr1 family TA system antitoxin-like transcriptional regulator n=1 Tax=Nocardiopsis alba TaxID=53437 RepID=UPI0033F42B92
MKLPPFHELLKLKCDLAGLTQAQLAGRMGCSTATVSRWANGHAAPHRETAERLDKQLNANNELISAWEQVKSTKITPEWAESLNNLEDEALHVQVASPALVPGYLQSLRYAAEVFRAWSPSAPDEEIQELARIRVDQLEQMPSLRVTAVFPVLGLTAFDAEVQKDQARHLLKLVQAGRVRVHLVPEGSLLLSVTSPVLIFQLKSGARVMSSDHLDGNFIYDVVRTERLAPLVAGAMAEALPARLSIEVLKGLT